MKVYGVEINQDVIDKVENEFLHYPSSFTMTSLDMALQSLGVPMYKDERSYSVKRVSNRAADRILQAWRKSGRIIYKNKMWNVNK